MMGSPFQALPLPAAWSLALPRWLAVDGVMTLAFRGLLVACQAATILITWPLWQARAWPPLLPALPLPSVDVGPWLLATLALVVVRPRVGLIAQSLLLFYAILVDQTRIQPELISLLILQWGTLNNPTARGFARAHLIALWFYSGFNKVLSPSFMGEGGTAEWILSGFPLPAPTWLYPYAGYFIALTELGIGVLAIVPRTRRISAIVALMLHVGILLDLGPLGHNWNPSVWPWNVALAGAGLAFIAPWRESPLASLRQIAPLARPLIVLLLIAPLGFYFGLIDAYLAHNLYSSNTARAAVVCPATCPPGQDPHATWRAMNVPLPPEHRLYEQFFAHTCRPGDRLVITDSRWWYAQHDAARRIIACGE